ALPKALEAARKAMAVDPNLPAAHMCTALVYEAQRQPPDSIIAAARRGLRGDSLNGQAWRLIFSQAQVKGDTATMIEALSADMRGDPGNAARRIGYANLLYQMKRYDAAAALLDQGLALFPTDKGMLELKARVCIEGERWTCALEALKAQALADSSLLADSTFLMSAIGVGQRANDGEHLKFFGRAAVAHSPRNTAFWKSFGSGFELTGQPDSAVWAYRKAFELDPSAANGLLVAKPIVEGATYDTAAVGRCRGDTACVARLRRQLVTRLDSARAYLTPAAQSSDTLLRVGAASFMRTAGEKLVRAGALDPAYSWLDPALRLVAPRTPADTGGVRQRVRVNTSFWYVFAAVPRLGQAYPAMTKSKSCERARAFNDDLVRTREAFELGRTVHPPSMEPYRKPLTQIGEAMPQVRRAFKCTNF
ncbi:MAG: tetratricopeptide repeat protein, partial [Gemmatimonadales bacterium]